MFFFIETELFELALWVVFVLVVLDDVSFFEMVLPHPANRKMDSKMHERVVKRLFKLITPNRLDSVSIQEIEL